MPIRRLEIRDIPRLKELYGASGFAYEWPDLTSPLFIDAWVVTDSDGVPVQACAARLTVELYSIFDQNWETPGIRWHAFAKMHEACRQSLAAKGIFDVHCWLPPQVKHFGRRLVRHLKYQVNDWLCLSRPTGE